MFNLISKYKPTGDQPSAIKKLVQTINEGKKHQILLGVTGSGKTFTVANIIKETGKPGKYSLFSLTRWTLPSLEVKSNALVVEFILIIQGDKVV